MGLGLGKEERKEGVHDPFPLRPQNIDSESFHVFEPPLKRPSFRFNLRLKTVVEIVHGEGPTGREGWSVRDRLL